MFQFKSVGEIEKPTYTFKNIDDSHRYYNDYEDQLSDSEYISGQDEIKQENVDIRLLYEEASKPDIKVYKLKEIARQAYAQEIKLLNEWHTCRRCRAKFRERDNFNWECRFNTCHDIGLSLHMNKLHCCGFGRNKEGKLVNEQEANGCLRCDHMSDSHPEMYEKNRIPWILKEMNLVTIDPEVIKEHIKKGDNKLHWHYLLQRQQPRPNYSLEKHYSDVC